jgi:hypothetical protein
VYGGPDCRVELTWVVAVEHADARDLLVCHRESLSHRAQLAITSAGGLFNRNEAQIGELASVVEVPLSSKQVLGIGDALGVELDALRVVEPFQRAGAEGGLESLQPPR